MSTPKILHQTWKTLDVPPNLKAYADSCKKQNLDYEYRLWTDDDLRRLIANDYPQYLVAFDSFAKNIERVDFARYAMMHSIGGVYADLDIQCLKTFDPLVALNKPVLGSEPKEHRDELYERRRYVICNALLISPPGHPLWIQIMDFIVQHYKPGVNPVVNTGPMALTLLYEDNPHAYDDVLITNPCIFYGQTDFKTKINQVVGAETIPAISNECSIHNAITVHRWAHTWCGGNEKHNKTSNYFTSIGLIFLIIGIVMIVVGQIMVGQGRRGVE